MNTTKNVMGDFMCSGRVSS